MFADGARHRQDRRSGAGAFFLTRHDHWRAWKGFDWDALSRLHDKGMIADPVNKAKSVVFTEEGLKRAEELFRIMFTKPD